MAELFIRGVDRVGDLRHVAWPVALVDRQHNDLFKAAHSPWVVIAMKQRAVGFSASKVLKEAVNNKGMTP